MEQLPASLPPQKQLSSASLDQKNYHPHTTWVRSEQYFLHLLSFLDQGMDASLMAEKLHTSVAAMYQITSKLRRLRENVAGNYVTIGERERMQHAIDVYEKLSWAEKMALTTTQTISALVAQPYPHRKYTVEEGALCLYARTQSWTWERIGRLLGRKEESAMNLGNSLLAPVWQPVRTTKELWTQATTLFHDIQSGKYPEMKKIFDDKMAAVPPKFPKTREVAKDITPPPSPHEVVADDPIIFTDEEGLPYLPSTRPPVGKSDEDIMHEQDQKMIRERLLQIVHEGESDRNAIDAATLLLQLKTTTS